MDQGGGSASFKLSDLASFLAGNWTVVTAANCNTTGTDSNPAFALVPGGRYIIDPITNGAFELALPDPTSGGADILLRDANSSNTSGWTFTNDSSGTGIGSFWYAGTVTNLSSANITILPSLNGDLRLACDSTDVQWNAGEVTTSQSLWELLEKLASGGAVGIFTFPNVGGTFLMTNGNGSALTNLNASNISGGTISPSRLPITARIVGGSSFTMGNESDQTLVIYSATSPIASFALTFPSPTPGVVVYLFASTAVTSFSASYPGVTLDVSSLPTPTSLTAGTQYRWVFNSQSGTWIRTQ